MKVNEIFYSLQGEGILIGKPMVFVRFSGCNLMCTWCDTKYAWEEGKEMEIDDILSIIRKFDTEWICLTGGEPLIQKDIYKLINILLNENKKILLETNGSISIENVPTEENIIIDMDIKTPSSGMQQYNDFSNLELLGPKDYVKFVIKDRDDYEYAKDIIKKYNIKCEIVFQPEGNKNIRELAEWVLNDKLNVRVLIQLHKIIWGDVRGK
ncbi:MAG: 7-carboxy-7-deazaguanine synthase QueE [Thermoplasmata archaeon]